MNLLGKIFLFAVFVMSLTIGLLATAIAISHRDWKAEVMRTREQCLPDQPPGYLERVEKARSDNESFKAEVSRLQSLVAESEASRDRVISKLQSALIEKSNEGEALEAAEEQLKAEKAHLEALVRKVKSDLDVAKSDVETLMKKVKDQQSKVDAQVERSAALSKELADTNSFLVIAEERKEQLERLLVNARLILQQSGLDVDSRPKHLVPALDGQVLAVGSGSIEAEIGSDDGLQVDHVLEIYRQGEYIGRATVTSVRPDRAIARLLREYSRGVVQRGDRVTTRLQQ